MIIFAPLFALVGIGVLCWLMFTLAIFALPFFVGLTVGIWAFHTGAGVFGGILVGLAAGAATFGAGRFALALIRWTWLRLLIILIFVVPAAAAGYGATHGLAHLMMPSETFQMIFSVIGAIAVAITAFVRLIALAPPGLAGQDIARR
jgi:hypothetical protein